MRFFCVLVLFGFLVPSCALAQLDVAQIELVNDVDDVRYATRELDFDRLEPIRFFQWESVELSVTAERDGAPVD
ncbi:MAG TPA: hypothetical protein VJ904_07035, partial [Tichowtungia sp.]|nr:hypothetical protein [Tichowtungia sp.]